MLKKLVIILLLPILTLLTTPSSAFAAAGIYPSGNGITKTVGQTFTINVVASGAEFNAFQGTISAGGEATVTSFVSGSADTWMSKPTNGGTFSGALLGRKANSLTIATITMRAKAAGKATVTVSGVVLKNGASTVGTGGGTSTINIQKAPELPGAVSVSSSTHPDQSAVYEETSVNLSWEKAAGVDGFSYLLDQAEATAPAAKINDTSTTATYDNLAIGTHFFHIRAHKPDGWGATTHFRINIKEPEPKINETLPAAEITNVVRVENAVNDIQAGTLNGIEITGKTVPGFTANIIFEPALLLPEGKTTSVVSGPEGDFLLLIDFPLPAGFYKISAQGQQEKILTPISAPVSFEISLKDGGKINYITETDIFPPVDEVTPEVKGSFLRQEYPVMNYLIFTLVLAIIIFGVIEAIIFIRRKRARL